MEIDGALVMENFLGMMGNLFVTLGFVGLITLAVTGAYIYIVHVSRKDYWDDFE